MKVNKIEIRGFKSIEKPLILDFTTINGMIKITGNVGSGKTSIGEAILFGLFGTIKGKVNDDIINWKSNELYVEIEVECHGKTIVVKRGMKRTKSGGVSATVFDATCDGELIKFSSKKEAQSILETEYYDTNRLAIELFCIISFNNFKSLLTMKTADKNAFLDNLFGFEVITKYIQGTKDFIKTNKTELQSIENQIDKYQSNIETLNSIKTPQTIDIQLLRDAYSKADNLRATYEDQKKADTDDLLTTINELNEQLVSEQADMNEILTLGNKVKRDIETFKTGVCPTCGQPVAEHLMENLKSQQSDLRDKYVSKKSIIDGITTQRGDYQREVNSITSRLNEKILEQQNIMDDAKQRAAINKRLQEQYTKQMAEKDAAITELESQIEESKKEKSETETDLNIYTDIQDILANKIKSKILQSFIPAINSNVAKYTSQLKLPFVVQFDEEFNIIVMSTVYNKIVSTASLSTGQTKALDTCIIIGILNALLNKINFNITFFDELMSNMDENMRDDICKILHDTLKPSTTLFIISHSPLKDEFFNHSIEVSNKLGSNFTIK